jgi:hypothetical protein
VDINENVNHGLTLMDTDSSAASSGKAATKQQIEQEVTERMEKHVAGSESPPTAERKMAMRQLDLLY